MEERERTVVVIGALFLLFLLFRRAPLLAPAGSPAFGTFTRGGSNVTVPGVGSYATGPGGTSIVLDPRLFGGGTGATSGAGLFNPGSGVLTPLVPFPPGAPGGGAIDTGGNPPVDPIADPTGTDPMGGTIATPDWAPPPETPSQIPLATTPLDPSILDPNSFSLPPVALDPTVLDSGLAGALFSGDALAF